MPNPSDDPITLESIIAECRQYGATLVAVSKTRPEKAILDLYKKGLKIFGENRAHELIIKASLLPSDIEWHLIGHLQTNKVKSILPFVHCIQSLDSQKLWEKIHQEALEAELKVSCLLQIKIATEESKYGWDFDALQIALDSGIHIASPTILIEGVMGMASLTDNKEQIRKEFRELKSYFDMLKEKYFNDTPEFNTISMGMSNDYRIALAEGSTMIRVGSLLFDEKK